MAGGDITRLDSGAEHPLASEITKLTRELAVAPISNGDGEVRLRGIYSLPAAPPFSHRYLVAHTAGVYGEEPADYNEWLQLSLYDEMGSFTAKDVDKEGVRLNPTIVVSSESGHPLSDVHEGGLDIHPRAVHHFLNWLRPLIGTAALEPLPETMKVLHTEPNALMSLDQHAKTFIDTWGTDGKLRLDTYVRDHQTMILSDEGHSIVILGDWLKVAEGRKRAVLRSRDELLFSDEGVATSLLLEGQDGIITPRAEDEDASQEDAIRQFINLARVARNSLALAEKSDVVRIDAPFAYARFSRP